MFMDRRTYWRNALAQAGLLLCSPFVFAADAPPQANLNPDRVFDQVLTGAQGEILPISLQRDSCLPAKSVPHCNETEEAEGTEPTQTPQIPERPDSDYVPRQSPSQQFSNQQPQSYNFGGGPQGGMTMASNHIPGMLGDFFGGTQGMQLQYPGQMESLPNSIEGSYIGFHLHNGTHARFEATFNSNPINFISTHTKNDIATQWAAENNRVNNIISVINNSLPPNVQLPLATGDLPGIHKIHIGIDNSSDEGKSYNNAVAQHYGYAYVFTTGGIAIRVDKNAIFGVQDTTITNGEPDELINNDPAFLQNSDLFTLNIDAVGIPIGTAIIPSGAVTGRVKLSENSSPIPRDRIIMDYSMFHNTRLQGNGISVNRFTPGFEKTFFDGDMSVELRVPFATTLDSDIGSDVGGTTNTRSVEFGNATVHLKALLYNNDTFAFSTGLGMAFPTADDISYNTANGVNVFKLSNDAVHMMPFIGFTSTPNERVFHQGTLQVDTAVSGNATYFNTNPNSISVAGPTGLQYAGTMRDPVFMYLDYNMGYWFIRENPFSRSDRRLTGLAGMLELHYNTTLNGFDAVSMGIPNTDNGTGGSMQMSFGNKGARFNQLSATVGTVVELGYDTSFSFGYALPLSEQRMFDGEFRCNFTHLFGRSSVRSPQNSYGNMVRNRSL